MRRIVFGFRHLLHGVREVFRTKGIVQVVMPPVLINILIFFFIGWVVIRLIGTWTEVSFGDVWYGIVVSIVLSIFVVAILVFVFMMLFMAITAIIGAPFYEIMADKMMKSSGLSTGRSVWKEIGFSVRLEIKK